MATLSLEGRIRAPPLTPEDMSGVDPLAGRVAAAPWVWWGWGCCCVAMPSPTLTLTYGQ